MSIYYKFSCQKSKERIPHKKNKERKVKNIGKTFYPKWMNFTQLKNHCARLWCATNVNDDGEQIGWGYCNNYCQNNNLSSYQNNQFILKSANFPKNDEQRKWLIKAPYNSEHGKWNIIVLEFIFFDVSNNTAETVAETLL